LNDLFELPSLEEIEQMDRQRLQAIESLDISNDYVKCQRCGIAIPLLRTSTKPRSNRIAVLEKQIKWIENYSRSGNINRPSYTNEVKALKAEVISLFGCILCCKALALCLFSIVLVVDFAVP
jgi:hypothetical protein